MKQLPVIRHWSFAEPRSCRSGMALVIVLGMLVLVLILVIAFFSSVSVDLQSAKRYSSGTAARTLADSAVSLVISQIQDATAAPNLAWASQPGMIRTYKDTGAPAAAFKLYSSGSLQVDGAFDSALQAAEVPADWAGNTTLFTDLNKPVAVAGVNHYPILDPAAVAKDVSGDGITGTALDGVSVPIEGCFLVTSNAATATSATQTNPVPMPVQWMYVLESGKLEAMDPTTKIIAGASSTDPIVGRIAFWTDDETSKVNINTASEGTFWDRPWTKGTYEASLNTSMPVQNEFQRFPGHPAMTSLSTIFPALGGTVAKNEAIYGIMPRVSGGGSVSGSAVTTGSNSAFPIITPDAERLFASVDEFFFNGLRAENPFSQKEIEKSRFFLTANSRAPEVNLFNKPRITLWPLQKDPDPGDNSATRTAKDKLIAFCSTIGSGASAKPYYFERYNTYLFDKNVRPSGADNWANKQDPMPSSQSASMDWTNVPRNQQLYKYLQSLTSSPIPGLGGSLLGKYPNTRDQILVESLDYIRSTVNPQTTVTGQPSDNMEYFYAPGYKNFKNLYYNVIGQSQVVPLVVPGSGSSIQGKGFGRMTSIKQAVLVFYASNPGDMKIKPTLPAPSPPTYTVDTQKMNESPMTMRAVLLLDPFTVTPGSPSLCANLRYRVTWESPCKVNDADLNFPPSAVSLLTARDQDLNKTPMGGIEYPFKYYEKPNSGTDTSGDHFDLPKVLGVPVVGDVDEEKYYPFFSAEVTVPGITPATLPALNPNLPSFKFEGGTFKIEIFPGYERNPALDSSECIQTIHIAFPATPIILPRPDLETSATTGLSSDPLSYVHAMVSFNARLAKPGIEPGYNHSLKPMIRSFDTVRSVELSPTGPAKGDLRVLAALKDVPVNYFAALTDYGTVNVPFNNNLTLRSVHNYRMYPSGLNGSASNVYPGYNVKPPTPVTNPITTQKIKNAVTGTFDTTRRGKLVAAVTYRDDRTGGSGYPIVPSGLASATMNNNAPGDWDTGPGGINDGAYINPADQGNNSKYFSYYSPGTNPQTWMFNENGSTYSPSRQISSAVSFGSLPTGINPNNPTDIDPWRTLLFCKNPAAGSAHPGFGNSASGPPYTTAPDHVFLDLFTMPVVEPYAISEPFSTAGKVNMNYQLMPFTYLTRDTAVRSVLKSTKIMAIPTADGTIYKQSGGSTDYRYTIDPDEQNGTLAGFEQRFTGGDIFRSASEICDIYLVPKYRVNSATPAPGSPTYSTMGNWWSDYQLTGDNVREQPYGHIYPRLTTKSNTFTVHVQAQSIAKSRNTPADQFVEGKDQITGEFRGSFLIERYLDPNSDSLVKADGKTATDEMDPEGMVGPYKFRVVSTKKFAP